VGGSGWAGQWRRNGWGFIRGRKGGGRGRPRRVTLQETVCGLRSCFISFVSFFSPTNNRRKGLGSSISTCSDVLVKAHI
jgi:hypothetical protein